MIDLVTGIVAIGMAIAWWIERHRNRQEIGR